MIGRQNHWLVDPTYWYRFPAVQSSVPALQLSDKEENDLVKAYEVEMQKYKQDTKQKKGSSRETDTMAMLAGFQSTLSSVAMMAGLGGEEEGEEGGEEGENSEELDDGDITWWVSVLNTTIEFFVETTSTKILYGDIVWWGSVLNTNRNSKWIHYSGEFLY